MGFVSRGGLAAIFLLLSIACCVIALFPKVFWITKEIQGTEVKESLWKVCAAGDCKDLGKIDPKTDFKSESTGERDGTIAGLVLSGLFSLISLLTVCCNSRGATIGLTIVSFLFAAATVGCFYRYKTHTIDNAGAGEFKWSYGFGIDILAMIFALVAACCACCMGRSRSDYYQIA